MNRPPSVSIVIVSWNHARWLPLCLDALARTDYAGEWNAVVVDNASTDASAEVAARRSPAPAIVENRVNRGFGGGNNDGWRAANGEIVVFLNPDTQVRPGWLAPLVETLVAKPDVGVVGARLLRPDGRRLQHAGGLIHPNGMGTHRGADAPDGPPYDTPREVDYVTGAVMAIRRTLLEETGGFDEDFFPAYFEETDLCLEARNRGLSVVYEPRSVVVHHESVSLQAASPRFLALFTRQRMRLALKRFSAADWLFGFLPFELRWYRSWMAAGARRHLARSYAWALGVAFGLRSRE